MSDLTLSGVDLSGFAPYKTLYRANVPSDVAQITVTPTLNHSGASYVIKLNGVVDTDGVIPLTLVNNVIAIEVTAEDGIVSETYTVFITSVATIHAYFYNYESDRDAYNRRDIHADAYADSGSDAYTDERAKVDADSDNRRTAERQSAPEFQSRRIYGHLGLGAVGGSAQTGDRQFRSAKVRS